MWLISCLSLGDRSRDIEKKSTTNFFLCVMREEHELKNTSKFQFESRSSKWYVVVVVAFECLSMITEMSHVFLYVSSFFFSCFFPTLIIDLIFLLTDQAQAQHRSTWMVERGKNSWNYFVDDISSVIKNWC